MAKVPKLKAEDSAEQAYAAAAEAAPVEFPSKARRGGKTSAPAPVAESTVVEPVTAAPIEESAPIAEEAVAAAEPDPIVPEVLPEVLEASEPAPIAVKAARPARRIAAVKPRPVKHQPKPIATKTVAARKPAAVPAKPVAAKPVFPKPVMVSPKPISNAPPKTAPTRIPVISQLKDSIMATKTSDFISDVKTKAKAAFDKGTSSIGDVTDFAKGNVEAVVESGKIYAAGLKDMGTTYAAEGKSAFEAMSADVKTLASQKTPVDFFKLQGEFAKKNFESAMAFGTKSSEAWMKLASDAFAPLSGRVTLAVDKIKAAA